MLLTNGRSYDNVPAERVVTSKNRHIRRLGKIKFWQIFLALKCLRALVLLILPRIAPSKKKKLINNSKNVEIHSSTNKYSLQSEIWS